MVFAAALVAATIGALLDSGSGAAVAPAYQVNELEIARQETRDWKDTTVEVSLPEWSVSADAGAEVARGR